MPEWDRLQDLADEYAALCRLEGWTPQRRGQRLNGLLSDMFTAWGHRAASDVNARGNIDVAVALDGSRYILEAKWEDKPIGTGPIAKLQKRVRQRFGGTIGIFVSMSGYTPDALQDLKDGERLEIILLEREHIEAMLSGFCQPVELFARMLDKAHFEGKATTSLTELLWSDITPDLQVSPGSVNGMRPLSFAVEGVQADWLASNVPFGQSGLSLMADGRLLILTGRGLVVVDPKLGTVAPLASPSHVSAAKALPTGQVAVVRGSGVAVVEVDGTIRVRGGPLPGRVTFAAGGSDEEELIVFSNGDYRSRGASRNSCAMLVAVGAALGDERFVRLDYPAAQAAGALRLPDDRVLLLGNPSVIIGADGTSSDLNLRIANPFGACLLDSGRYVLVGGGDVDLLVVDICANTAARMATVNLHGSIVEVVANTSAERICYVFAHYERGSGSLGAVVRVELPDLQKLSFDAL